jgi:acylphosphatase
VQGVCYRAGARDSAQRLGLTGWVRNRPDGTVEIVAEGVDEDLRKLIDWCRRGPPHAAVRNVEIEFADATGDFAAFEVTY